MNASTFSSTTASPASAARQPLSRNALIALVVVALHVVFIWVLQNGLLMHSTELVVPAEILSQFIDTPAPRVEPAPPVPPTPAVQKKTASKAPAQRLQPQARHLAIADTTPSLDAPTGVVTPPLAPDPVAEAPAAAAPADQVVMQLPSSNAGYLQNPTPPYPPLSARLGETGRVVYQVWIGPDGKAQRAELVSSSGFPRLDKAAYETVMRWRYVPGKRNGVPETMPFNVPISWELRN
jgi:protein TonB